MNGKYILIATLPDLDVSEVNLCLQMHRVELFKKKNEDISTLFGLADGSHHAPVTPQLHTGSAVNTLRNHIHRSESPKLSGWW